MIRFALACLMLCLAMPGSASLPVPQAQGQVGMIPAAATLGAVSGSLTLRIKP